MLILIGLATAAGLSPALDIPCRDAAVLFDAHVANAKSDFSDLCPRYE